MTDFIRNAARTSGLLILLLTTNPAIALEAPTRILPLGDSLTEGVNDTFAQGGYRKPLHTLLSNDGFNVDFVGTFQDDPGQGADDPDHQGMPSFRIDEIQANLAGWLDAVEDPDVVLLLIGTNDIWQNHDNPGSHPLPQTEANLGNLIADIATRRPFAKIIVSTLPPRIDNASIEADQQAFNAALPEIVTQQVALGRQVSLVDMHPVLTDPGDYSMDGVHPSTAGYAKMADAWHEAIADPVNGVITPHGTSNPPVIAHVGLFEDLTQVSLVFSKPVADDSANVANFSISGGLEVSGATLDSSTKRIITLTTGPQTPGVLYTISASGVRDRTAAQTLIAPASMASFARDPVANGGFEDDYDGWIVDGNSEIQLDGTSGYVAAEGTKLVSFNSGNAAPGGSLSQTIATIPGRTYQLAFEFGILCSSNNIQQQLDVIVQGSNELLSDSLFIQRQGGVNIHWEQAAYVFTANSSTAEITFTDESLLTNGIDLLLDHVRVELLEIPTLALTSSPTAGAAVTVSQNDIAANGNGTTGMIRYYNPGTSVTLATPAVFEGRDFLHWRKNGVDLPPAGNTIQLTMDSSVALDAVYDPDAVDPLTVFEQWLDGYGLAAAPTEDSDGDSIPNVVEYVIGGNPANLPSNSLLPTVARVSADPDGDFTDSDYLLFTFRRTDLALADPNTTIAVEWTIDPAGPWTDSSETVGAEMIVDDDLADTGVDLVRVYLPESLASEGKLFARLRVMVSQP